MKSAPYRCSSCGERLYATVNGYRCFNCGGER